MVKVLRPTSNNNETTDKKKKNKKRINPNSITMKVKAPVTKPNPFESVWSRRKFDILGKKRKGEERRIGLARSLAIEKRKKTLLKDYEKSGKSSVFVDKRIGEGNDDLGEFDKGILRSQRERQMRVKLGKKNRFNLSDGEEDEYGDQDGGLYPERDDYDDAVPFDEEEDEVAEADKKSFILKQLSANGTPGAHTSGPEGEENRPKTNKEVFGEIIAKSKHFKAEKAKDKEENDQLIKKLDEQFTSMQSTLAHPNQINVSIDVTSKTIKSFSSSRVEPDQEKADAYDKLLSEMVLDMRARPSNRTKTPEELAQEEKERLEELEEERQKRMNAVDDTSDEDNDDNDHGNMNSKKLKSISGDDLGDSFADDEPKKTKLAWIQQMLRKENEIDDEDEDDDDDDEEDDDEEDDDDDDEAGEEDEDEGDDVATKQSLKDWEQSDDDEGDDDDDDDIDLEEKAGEHDDVDLELKPRDSKKDVTTNKDDDKKDAKVKHTESQQKDLPYTIEAPKTIDDLSALFDNRSDDEVIEAIRRIRAFNAIKIAAENRKKIQVFYGLLLQYFSVSANKKPLNFKLLNLLVKPLMEMSIEIPYFAAICARERLLRTRSLFAEDIKNSDKSCWPSMKTLFLLRLWSMIFPCSDFRHVVMTPAILLMCEYLTRCPIISGRDVAIGSFLCSMVLSACKQSKKFCPEAVVFLRTVLMSASDKKPEPSQDSELYHLMELKSPKPLLCIRGTVDDDIKPLDFLMLMDSPDDSPYFTSDKFRASMLAAVVDTLQGYANIYEDFKSFPEIFMPISNLLVELTGQDHIPVALKDKMKTTVQLIEKKVDEHFMLRRPLQMRKQKPVPIKLLNPKFEENFVSNRDYDPDRQRAEDRKLKKLVKREAKGAARELRKDNYFLAEANARDKARLDAEKTEEYGRTKAFLQEQEHAFKSGQLGKGKKRRR